MKPEPPDSLDPETGSQAQPDEAREPFHGRPLPTNVTRWALIAGLLVGGAIATVRLVETKGPEPFPLRMPERGAACPFLQDALEELQHGNTPALLQKVQLAAHEAEETLKRSGQLFGRPEALAFKLAPRVRVQTARGRVRALGLFHEIEDVCAALGRWRS